MNKPIIDSAEFRRILGHLPTGVVAVTSVGDDEPVGMACNSFISVSLDPALVGFCAATSSSTWPIIRNAGRFCVNVMAEDHADLTRNFSRKGIDRFEGVEWAPRSSGPGLEGAVAWIDCTLWHEYEAGDHTIVLGQVHTIEAASEVSPLVFYEGSSGAFADWASRLS